MSDKAEQKIKEITELSKPIVKWLNDNSHPHSVVVIMPNGFQVMEGILGVPISALED